MSSRSIYIRRFIFTYRWFIVVTNGIGLVNMASLWRYGMTRVPRFIKRLMILLLLMAYFLCVVNVITVINRKYYSNDSSWIGNNTDINVRINLTTGSNDGERLEVKRTFTAGLWQSSYVSPFHKHYNVNCSGVLHGNQSAIDSASKIVERERESGKLRVPSDQDVSKWTENCEVYKKTRRYPSKPWSQEEADYPVAYILTVHKASAQFERLLRAIYQPQNVYCIHVDINSPGQFLLTILHISNCFDNVFLASKMEKVVYRGFSRVQADLNCMEDLMSYRWNYLINLCGQDFPLKTNLEIVKQLKAYKGQNDIPGVFPKQTTWFISRTMVHHENINGEWTNTGKKKLPPPHNALMYFGNAYYATTRDYVEYVLNNQTAKNITEYLSDSYSPDEHVWVTLTRYPGVPGGYPNSTWASNVRFIRWTNSYEYEPCIGKYVRAVCIIGTGFLPYVSKQPHMFVNKIHYDYDPITLQCLEELLDFRTTFPETIDDYVQPYPVTDIFTVSPNREPSYLYKYM